MSSVSATKSVSVPELDYDQTLQQLSTLKDDDVLCIEDGRLCAWKKDSGSGGPNTNAVMFAVKDMLTKKMGNGGFGDSDIKKGLKVINGLKNSASDNKNNYWYAGDVKKLLLGFKDINSKPGAKTQAPANTKTPAKTQEPAKTEVKTETKTEEAKGVGSVPKPGETLTMTRAELEKNLDSWIKAGFRVTVEVENKGSYQLQGRSETDKKPHMYDALYTSADGKVSNEKCLFELPDSSYAVSQPTAKTENKSLTIKLSEEKTESKPLDSVSDKKSFATQTRGSNTCFIWSVANSVKHFANGLDKERLTVGETDKDGDSFVVYNKDGKREKQSIKALETRIKQNEKGAKFLKRLQDPVWGLKAGFERNLALYSYAENKKYQEAYDALGSFPVGECDFTAKAFGLQPMSQEMISFKKKDQAFEVQQKSEDVKSMLESVNQHLKNGNVVTLNMDGVHFVTVTDIDLEKQSVTYVDSLYGNQKTGSLSQLAGQYNSGKHAVGLERTLAFSVYGMPTAAAQKNVDDVVALFKDISSGTLANNKPTSMLGKALVAKGFTAEDLKKSDLPTSALTFLSGNDKPGEIEQKVQQAVNGINGDDDKKSACAKPIVGGEDQKLVALLSSINDFVKTSGLVGN